VGDRRQVAVRQCGNGATLSMAHGRRDGASSYQEEMGQRKEVTRSEADGEGSQSQGRSRKEESGGCVLTLTRDWSRVRVTPLKSLN
jgi:hypothetical protein